MLFLRVSAALLLCGYCAVSILADRAKCPDFNNIDFCDDEDNDFDLLQVSFGECNAIVTPHNARHEPVVKYNDAEEDKKYILLMVDPDAPNRQTQAFKWWRHWFLTDVPGWSLLSNSAQSLPGSSVTDYNGPSPPPGTGYHRYQLLLFEQDESYVEPVLNDGIRGNWNLNTFVRTNNLCNRLVAATQFLSANQNSA